MLERLGAFTRDIWRNYPVRDERKFLDEFREHAFADSRIATWVAAIGGTVLMVQRTLITPLSAKDPPALQVLLERNAEDIGSGLLLFWAAPIVFAIAVNWSKRNYQWVLMAVFGLRYLRLADNTLDEYASAAIAAVPALHLSLFASAFLRLPFHVAFLLSIAGTALITTAAFTHFGPLATIPFLVPVAIAVGLGLFASWRAERRERRLFELRERAENAADEARQQTRRTEEAMNETLASIKQKQALLDELGKSFAQRNFMIKAFHHDAKQPLIAIAPAAREIEVLAAGDEAFAAFRSKSCAIQSSVSEFEQLVNGLEDLVVMGDFVPRYGPVSLNKMLAAVSSAYADAAREKKIEFEVRMRSSDIYLWTDATAAQRMLKNLVSNAIKYTPQGRVFVGAVKFRNELRIDVLDSGIGIPEEKKDDIYREFVRLDHPNTKRVGGLGLGLAIVAHFRDKLPGHDVEHNSAPGRGSRFSLRLPLAPSVPEFSKSDSGSPFVMAPEKVYVVLVEDHDHVRTSLKTLLESSGYDARDNVKDFAAASQLRAYFEEAQHRAPNIVISDNSLLGGETADDVMKIVDEFFSWAHVPVIIYTADPASVTPYERSHTHLLGKAGDPLPLLNLIQRAIGESRREESDD